MPKTYEPIASTSLPSGGTSVTFSSIPQTYTDLVLIVNSKIATSEDAHALQFNSDTGGNYSSTGIVGNGSSAFSYAGTNSVAVDGGRVGDAWCTSIFNIMNYANTTTYKSVLAKGSSTSTSSYVGLSASVWRSTAAISTILVKVYGGQTMSAGTTFVLYGIKAA